MYVCLFVCLFVIVITPKPLEGLFLSDELVLADPRNDLGIRVLLEQVGIGDLNFSQNVKCHPPYTLPQLTSCLRMTSEVT